MWCFNNGLCGALNCNRQSLKTKVSSSKTKVEEVTTASKFMSLRLHKNKYCTHREITADDFWRKQYGKYETTPVDTRRLIPSIRASFTSLLLQHRVLYFLHWHLLYHATFGSVVSPTVIVMRLCDRHWLDNTPFYQRCIHATIIVYRNHCVR